MLWYIRSTAKNYLNSSFPVGYLNRRPRVKLDIGYLITDYVEPSEGKLLSYYWTDKSHEIERRKNFFRDLSQIILSLAQFPFPRIGSLTIDDEGLLQLSNRPLTFRLQQLENKGVSTGISRARTYCSTDSYLADLLSCHERTIKSQANSIRGEADDEMQLSVLTTMTAVLPQFVDDKYRHGPFVFTLTDIHPNNVFVDKNWRITCIIDLEWACVKPVDMVLPPVWLTGRKVDELPQGDQLDKYKLLLDEFLECFEVEEKKAPPRTSSAILSTESLRNSWVMGRFWYFHALDNLKVMRKLYFQHFKSISDV